NARILINGSKWEGEKGQDGIAIIQREWKSGDVIELQIPMEVYASTWYENAIAVERGPLVYALKIEEEWKKKPIEDNPVLYGDDYFEVNPLSPWNYGIMDFKENVKEAFTVSKKEVDLSFPWNLQNAPVEIKVKAKPMPSWKMYNEMAGPQPYSEIIYGIESTKVLPVEEFTLIP